MRLLGSFELFKEYYDLDKKEFCFFETLQKTMGIYVVIGDRLTGLLVENNNLYFLNGEERILIKDSYRVLLNINSNTENELKLMDEGLIVVHFLYSVPDPKLNVSPFEYIDEEDFKWDDFIAKIINDKERQRNFVINLMETS